MGVVVQPVTQSVLRESVQRGQNVRRVVLERVKVDLPADPTRAPKRAPKPQGEWRILIFLNRHTDGITPALYRGGVRTFRTLDKAEAFGRDLMPLISVESYDVFLRRITEEAEALPPSGETPPADGPDSDQSSQSLAA